jgi:hypothetical protein
MKLTTVAPTDSNPYRQSLAPLRTSRYALLRVQIPPFAQPLLEDTCGKCKRLAPWVMITGPTADIVNSDGPTQLIAGMIEEAAFRVKTT